jgi:ABC-type oligopeptide transport system substrate-binding subunit
VDAARQRLAQAGLVAVALLAGCGSSSKPPPHGGPTLTLALPLLPRTLDPAKAGDMPSLNVTHELYAGLTRFSGTGVVPDLAQSWDVDQGGLVWTFHLRKNLRWSDDRRLTAADIRRSWLRALAPATGAPLSGPDLGIVRGARAFHTTGRGAVGVEAPDGRTLRVTLQHPIPWLDQLVAYPIASAYRSDAFSGPFRLASRSGGRLALERNFNYWNVRAVKPSRLVLTAQTEGADAILPRGLAPPGLPWFQTAKPPTRPGWRKLPTLSVELLWFATRRQQLSSAGDRLILAWAVAQGDLEGFLPPALPGRDQIVRRATADIVPDSLVFPLQLTLGYRQQDMLAPALVRKVVEKLARAHALVKPQQAASPAADLILLGWSSKIFDAYNIFDLFPCGSAFNVAHWCDHSYDELMRRAVRTLDDRERWRIERQILEELRRAMPAVAVSQPSEYVWIKSGVRGFSWSPIGFYELAGMTRS